MTKPDAYIYSIDVWEREIQDIIVLYGGDPEVAHGKEDLLLERFVRDAAFETRKDSVIHKKAMMLVDLLDRDRVRWYA